MSRPAPLPDPVELGFDTKFASWYPDQLTAIDKVILGTRRFTALAMPTGSGKSVTGIAAALLHPNVKRALYLTSTKGLSDQIHADFASVGVTDVRGQQNYECKAVRVGDHLDAFKRGRHTMMCNEGPCHSGVRCSYAPSRTDPSKPVCLAYGAVWEARRAEIVSTNYSMYFASTAYSEGLGTFDLLILDEAHDADKELESFLTFDITLDDSRALGSKWLKSSDPGEWRDWATYHAFALKSLLERREASPPKDPEGAKELRQLKLLLNKLVRLKDIDPLSWILDGDTMRARFSPMKVSKYAEEVLFRKVPHVLLMSATMTRKTTQLLGINPDDLSFWECPSRFPLERRPIISVNTHPPVRVDARMHDSTKYMWLRRIDRLIEPRRALGRKGIIHTVSYQRMKDLVEQSEHKDLMLIHDSSNTREMIQEFKRSTKPLILVSPAIVTGYDFPGDQCRYQIIGKVPMPDMRGPIMTARKEVDPDYAGYLAMQKLVQACGRPVRGPLDWAETFIIDDHFAQWFCNKYRKHAPRWFMDAIEYVETYPEPIDPNTFSTAMA